MRLAFKQKKFSTNLIASFNDSKEDTEIRFNFFLKEFINSIKKIGRKVWNSAETAQSC